MHTTIGSPQTSIKFTKRNVEGAKSIESLKINRSIKVEQRKRKLSIPESRRILSCAHPWKYIEESGGELGVIDSYCGDNVTVQGVSEMPSMIEQTMVLQTSVSRLALSSSSFLTTS